jgi:pSer/pThr/pTyr-binding forkhead associated (FHA) protein
MLSARPGAVLRPLLALPLGLLSWLWLAVPGHAAFQTAPASAEITAVDASAFPDMQISVAVRGPQGRNVTDLSATAFEVAENGAAVPAVSVSETEVGVQVAFVIAPDDMFIKRDSTGTSRMDYVKASVGDFLVERPWMRDEVDDVSILTPEGPLVLHGITGGALQDELAAYNPPAPAPQEGSTVLALVGNAIEAAQPVGPSQGRPAAVVVYCTGLTQVTPDQIEQVVSQARALSVPVFAVNVSPALDPESVSAMNLRALAEGSGGQMTYFDTPDEVTPIFEAIASQRSQYLLAYRSGLTTSGQPAITVTVDVPEAGGQAVTSEPVNFALSVSPPQVTVTGMPSDILREPQGEPTSAFLDYPLSIKIAFPDGHPRAVRRLRLLVDGEVLVETTEPPFDRVILKASDIEGLGPHTVEVEVTDELGIGSLSVPMQLEITETEPAAEPEAEPAASPLNPSILGAAGAIVALILLGIGGFVLARRSGLFGGLSALADRDETVRVAASRRNGPGPGLTNTQPIARPVVKPARVTTVPAKEASGVAELEAVEAAPEPVIPRRAYLEVIQLSEGARTPVEINAVPITLGRDPALAAVTFAERSVSRLHARIEVDEQGAYHIYDEGSTSGTWVNYEQVTAAGRVLRQGDLINLGRIQLRFRMRAAVVPVQRQGSPGQGAAPRVPDDTTIPFKPKRRPWDRFRQ